MSRLGTFKTSMFSAFLAVAALVSCHAHASDRAVIEVSQRTRCDWLALVAEADIRGWVSQLHRRGLSGGSIQRSLSAARLEG